MSAFGPGSQYEPSVAARTSREAEVATPRADIVDFLANRDGFTSLRNLREFLARATRNDAHASRALVDLMARGIVAVDPNRNVRLLVDWTEPEPERQCPKCGGTVREKELHEGGGVVCADDCGWWFCA